MADSHMIHGESLFFAFKPDSATCERILETGSRLGREHGRSGRLFDATTLHMTLCPMGRPDRLRAPLENALGAAGALVRHAPIEVVLDRAFGFNTATRGYPNVLLANAGSAAAIAHLHQALLESQLRHGLRVGRSGFRPHVTLSRSSTCWTFDGGIEPIRWTAEEFVLVHSCHDGRCRRHDVLERWPLAAVDSLSA